MLFVSLVGLLRDDRESLESACLQGGENFASRARWCKSSPKACSCHFTKLRFLYL